MEWIETTGHSLEEAKEVALDQLGIDHDEAEFVVVEEPRQGLFGRTRGKARVRARVAPRVPRPKTERRGRRTKSDAKSATGNGRSTKEKSSKSTSEGDDAKVAPKAKSPRAKPKKAPSGAKTPQAPRAKRTDAKTEGTPMTLTLDEQVASAETFLTGLLGAFGLDGTVESERVDESTAELNVVGDDLGLLIGPRGQTISSIQELTRISLQRQAGGSYEGRVRIDVAGYRAQRRQALGRFVEKVAADVIETGKAKALEPMSASDRKAVHDAANAIDGVHTSSEGEEPRRWVMILPDAD